MQSRNANPQIESAKIKPESNLSAERVIKKLINFPVLGINIRDFEDDDCEKFHQSIGMNQAFSVDLFDKEGNKITAVLFGENAQHFCSVFKGNETHILSNLEK